MKSRVLKTQQCAILAGGRGTRLLPLTENLPKPLVSVRGKPYLTWQLEYLQKQGISEVVLLIGHLGHMIKSYFTNNPIQGLEVSYCQESIPLGTGGAVKNALSLLEQEFWLINGDSFLPLNFRAMESAPKPENWQACLACLKDLKLVPVPANVKQIENRVAAFTKGAGIEAGFTSVDAGVYLIKRNLLLAQVGHSKFDLESLWPSLIAKHQLGAYSVTERFFDIGTPDRLRQFEEHIHDYF